MNTDTTLLFHSGWQVLPSKLPVATIPIEWFYFARWSSGKQELCNLGLQGYNSCAPSEIQCFGPQLFQVLEKINQISFKLSFRPTPILGFQKQHLIFSMSSLPFSPIHPSIKPQFLPSNQTPFQLLDQGPSMKPSSPSVQTVHLFDHGP